MSNNWEDQPGWLVGGGPFRLLVEPHRKCGQGYNGGTNESCQGEIMSTLQIQEVAMLDGCEFKETKVGNRSQQERVPYLLGTKSCGT